MDAELLHPRRRAFDAIGIPVPEQGAEATRSLALAPAPHGLAVFLSIFCIDIDLGA
jgi:hypothetical protein